MTAPKPLPLEAGVVRRLAHHSTRLGWKTARVQTADLRSLLSSYEAQAERLRVVEEDAESDRAFHLEALLQIKAAVENGDNPDILIETATRMASIAEVRARNEARADLSQRTATENGK